jgi:hypothetical protein
MVAVLTSGAGSHNLILIDAKFTEHRVLNNIVAVRFLAEFSGQGIAIDEFKASMCSFSTDGH